MPRIHGFDRKRFSGETHTKTLPMNAHFSRQQDSTESASADAAMQELKGALQSAIVPLAGVWVAAGKALISGASEASLSAKPLETWEELKHAAKEAVEPLVDAWKDEHEAGERHQPSEPLADGPAMTRGSRRSKARTTGMATPTKRRGSSAKKRAGAVPSRNLPPRAAAK
jgi:hypothetical protein